MDRIDVVVGAQVVTKTTVDRYPDFSLPPGLHGTIVKTGYELVKIKMDEPVVGGAEWDHCVECYDHLTIGTQEPPYDAFDWCLLEFELEEKP